MSDGGVKASSGVGGVSVLGRAAGGQGVLAFLVAVAAGVGSAQVEGEQLGGIAAPGFFRDEADGR
ncbi:MAG: hypothetical protein PHC30_04875, partial [Lentisphaeria bacterium]|nr:hypothetical protein [Lentisphaeria bacterium]